MKHIKELTKISNASKSCANRLKKLSTDYGDIKLPMGNFGCPNSLVKVRLQFIIAELEGLVLDCLEEKVDGGYEI